MYINFTEWILYYCILYNVYVIYFADLQPGFDHNLRDKAGNTPLMVACQVGVSEIISFLLQSAVYPQSLYEDDDAM